MSDRQKEEERRDLEKLADAIELPQLKAAVDSLHPDFLVTDGAEVLGIEHTLMYIDQPSGGGSAGSDIRKAEALFDTFRRHAEQELKERFGNVEIGLYVDRRSDGTIPKGKDIPGAVAELILGAQLSPMRCAPGTRTGRRPAH